MSLDVRNEMEYNSIDPSRAKQIGVVLLVSKSKCSRSVGLGMKDCSVLQYTYTRTYYQILPLYEKI